MQFSTADRALYIKLVYYGPGLSGKTTNLETIHRLTDPARRQPMVSLKTSGDRTLFFDLLPFDLGQLNGLDLRLKLYTVPGQIQYDVTRRQVLAGADGVVFVADSQKRQREANAWMVRHLRNNLQDNNIDPETVPLVFQWNKRDLPDPLDVGEMQRDLNWRRVPALEAVAPAGRGVVETFREITVQTVEALAARAPALRDHAKSAELRGKIEQLFAALKAAAAAAGAAPAVETEHSLPLGLANATDDGERRDVLSLDHLLSEAVQANLAFSERLVAAAPVDALARARRERHALTRLVRIAATGPEPALLSRMLLAATLSALGLAAGAVLAPNGAAAPMRPLALAGRDEDPLNGVVVHGVGSLAAALALRPDPALHRDIPGELLFGRQHPALDAVRALLAVPFEGGVLGRCLLVAYDDRPTGALGPEDLEFAVLAASIASLAMQPSGALARR